MCKCIFYRIYEYNSTSIISHYYFYVTLNRMVVIYRERNCAENYAKMNDKIIFLKPAFDG